MASLSQLKFDPTQHDTDSQGGGSYENLPDGIYKLEITSSSSNEEHDGNDNLVKYVLKVTYEVIEPEDYKGRKVFGNFNLVNKSDKAQEIGNRDFAKLCRALDQSEPPDNSEDLHFREFFAKIGVDKGGNGYSPKNEIKTYYYPTDKDGNAQPAPTPEITGPETKAPANDNRKPAANDNGAAPTKRVWGKK